MKLLRGLGRLPRLLYLIAWGLWHGGAEHARAIRATPPDPWAQERSQAWFGRVLDCLGVRVAVSGRMTETPCLVVCNHISWLDILVLGSLLPIVFLSKAEVGRWPAVARLAHAGGTLFIERGRAGAARNSIMEIRRALDRQQSVAVFPEGTTSWGDSVRAFHPRLFAAAIESGRPVQPVALRYPHPEGVHPKVPYVDEQSLVANILGLLGCASVKAEVCLGPTLHPGDMARRQLADQAREFVAGVVAGQSRP